jgi:hypothetical protein
MVARRVRLGTLNVGLAGGRKVTCVMSRRTGEYKCGTEQLRG